jgi:hypothetical protein
MLDKGGLDGEAVWMRVLEAVRELRRIRSRVAQRAIVKTQFSCVSSSRGVTDRILS